MSNAKRAIMVPVMTLAVCAIAMVGLGFALQTSVTSDSNTFEKLMIDLDKDESALGNQTAPDGTGVNGLFNIEISTTKTSTGAGDSQNSTITQTLTNTDQYLKIFGNIPVVKLSVEVDGLSTTDGKVSSITMKILKEGDNAVEQDITLTTNSISGTINGTFNADLKCGIVYTVQITEINGVDVTHGTSTPLFSNNITEPVSLDFTFTAEPKTNNN